MMIVVLYGISTMLNWTAIAIHIVAVWHFRVAERLYLADIDRHTRGGK